MAIRQGMTRVKNWTFHPRHRHFWSKAKVGTLALLLVAVALIGFVVMVPEPNTWIGLKATSEYLAFRVTQPDFVAFRVGGMSVAGLDDGKTCVDGIVAPSTGSWMELRRGDKSDLVIRIRPEGGATTITDGGGTSVHTGEIVFSPDPKCAGALPTRIPINGPAVFGHQPEAAFATGVPADTLLKGAIEVYAFAQSRIGPLRFPKSIYRLSEFDIPPAAVVCADVEVRDGEPDLTCGQLGEAPKAEAERLRNGLRTWVGVATPAVFDNGFDIAATSVASGLIIETSFSFGRESVTHIDLGGHEQFYRDPNLLWLQIRFGAGLFILHLLVSVLEFFSIEKPAVGRT